MKKTRMLFVDGVDKCGKDTIIKELHKKTDYTHIIVNRSVCTNYVYSLCKRKTENLAYYTIAMELNDLDFVKFIYITADKRDIVKRMKKHNEKDIAEKDIVPIKKEYEKFYNQCNIKPIVINTSRMNVRECVNKVLRGIRC